MNAKIKKVLCTIEECVYYGFLGAGTFSGCVIEYENLTLTGMIVFILGSVACILIGGNMLYKRGYMK